MLTIDSVPALDDEIFAIAVDDGTCLKMQVSAVQCFRPKIRRRNGRGCAGPKGLCFGQIRFKKRELGGKVQRAICADAGSDLLEPLWCRAGEPELVIDSLKKRDVEGGEKLERNFPLTRRLRSALRHDPSSTCAWRV